MAKPPLKELVVIRRSQITEHMLRITLGGDDLALIRDDQESAYLKLVFPQSECEPTLMRTYTIRHQRRNEIDIDFALHGSTGPATTWAINTQPGDRVLVGGPGGKTLINHLADWYLLVGDMTALPSISVNLAQLPADACGYAVIEVASESDIQTLDHPQNLELSWVINPRPSLDAATLLSKVRALPWLDGQPAVWAACEFGNMLALRQFFKQECGIPRSHLYVSSYWQIGQSEDEHKIAKQQDSEQTAAVA
jgi:NADPH-dependent ferric siderophore reductase